MSEAKTIVMNALRDIPDTIDDKYEVLDNLYHRIRLKESRDSASNQGTLSTEDVREFFERKRKKV